MPDEKKSTGEPASSDEKSAPEESKPAAESKPAGEGEKPPAGEAPETPKPAAAEGSKPDAPAEKPAATESSQSDAPAAQPPSGEKPAPAEKGAEAAKPASSDKPADAEKPAAKPAAPAAKVDPKAGDEKPAAKPAAKPPPKKAPTEMETTPWEGPLVDRLKERFGDEITAFSSYKGDDFLVAKLPAVFTIIQYLKAEEGFDYLVDVTALHYPKKEKPFEVFWILYSHPHNVRIRVKTEVAEDESPRSVDSLYKTANWLEREVYDMFGITFAEHPNMTRILLPDEWQGYPLRKDYSIIEQDQEWIRENLNIESGQ